MQPDFDEFSDNERFQDDSEDDYTGSERDESDWETEEASSGKESEGGESDTEVEDNNNRDLSPAIDGCRVEYTVD
jgi:hypothetical protein